MMTKSGTLAIALTLVLAGFSGAANAAKFGVRVVSDTGEPVPGVAVCFGTHGNYKRFGALFTSSSGDAVLEVPNIPLVVTISKSRFTGMRITEPARRFNLIKEVKLRDGVPGPRCRAGTSLAEIEAAKKLSISDVVVQGESRVVTLFPQVTGNPSHFRVSKSESFGGAKWQKFTSTINLKGKLIETDAVYMQLRRYYSEPKGWFEARSGVVTVQMPKL